MIAPFPENEANRVEALKRHAILDTEPEQVFDDLVELAAKLCQTPIALVSLVDPFRQWFKAKVGITACDTSRDIAFCAHAILQREIFEVRDALHDPRFAGNPLVTENPFIRFYAGIPLVTHDGYALGTLCVIDRVPRELTADQRRALTALGRQAMSLLELRWSHILLEKSVAAENQARLTEAKLCFAIDHSIDGMAVLNRDGRYTYINQAHAEMYGYEPTDLIGKPWTVLYTPEWYSRIQDSYFPILLQQGYWRGEVIGKKKSGDSFSVEVSLALLPSHGALGDWLLCTCQDMTARKRAELAVKASEERLNLAVTAAHVGIFEHDHMNDTLYWSPILRGIYGMSIEEPGSLQRYLDLIHQADYDRVLSAVRQAHDPTGDGEFHIEHRIVRPDGAVRHLSLHSHTSFVGEGRARTPSRTIGTVVDITEKKAVERKLEQAAQNLEIRNRELAESHERALAATKAKSEFLASMSHEIRTPINSIVAMGELLQETSLSVEQREYVGRFSRAATSLLDLINDILDISKIEAGHLQLESVTFDLPDLIDKTCELMAVRAHAKQLELVAFVHPDIPTSVTGDPTRLRQVFVNLVGNAIKFTERGEVVIRLIPDETHGDKIHCSVSDTGIGIPEDKLPTVFDSFIQVDSSTTRKYGGTGLGLSISKRIVESMGGCIRVDSKLGTGTTFSFAVQLPEVPNQNIVSALPTLNLQGRCILVVDDVEANRLVIREYLSGLGALIIEADNGTAALMYLDRTEPETQIVDVAILDYHMPGMNGLDLGQAIRARPQYATLPLIMYLSDMLGNAARQAHALGISSYAYKPISRQKLLESLGFALNGKFAAPMPKDHNKVVEKPTVFRPLRILLAEDLEDNRAVMSLYLKETPYKIEMAENGRIAIEKLQSGAYDLVFMDIQMPIMDGLQATTAIRHWEREHQRKPTPIIALTGNAFIEDILKSQEAGCTAHLTKPIKKKALLEVICAYAKPRACDQAA